MASIMASVSGSRLKSSRFHISLYVIIPIIFSGLTVISGIISYQIVEYYLREGMQYQGAVNAWISFMGLLVFGCGLLVVHLMLKPMQTFLKAAGNMPALSGFSEEEGEEALEQVEPERDRPHQILRTPDTHEVPRPIVGQPVGGPAGGPMEAGQLHHLLADDRVLVEPHRPRSLDHEVDPALPLRVPLVDLEVLGRLGPRLVNDPPYRTGLEMDRPLSSERALVGERAACDRPSVADATDDVGVGHDGIGEEHLVERPVLVHLPDRAHLDAGLVHVEQQV